jgi:hypothetical protein
MMRFICRAALLCCLTAAGCSTQSFDLVVTNRTTDAVTVWITKDHGPYEDGWAPPEVVALSPGDTGRLGGHVLQAGQACEAKVKGKIDGGNVAILRIYAATDIDALLAISRGTPDRLDMPLNTGKSDLDVIRQDGQLTAVPHSPRAPAAP